MKRFLPVFIGILLTLTVAFAFFLHSKNASAAVTHIIISQVQIEGASADDEFVELYNPTNNPVDLSGYRLRRESQTAGTSSNLVASMSGTIPSHGYFLVAFPVAYTGTATPDLFYSATSSAIAPNNTVLLYSDAGVTLVDKVGIGTAVDNETASAATPSAGGSVQRKLDETLGHGLDTNNNSSDFEVLVSSTPRNSSIIAPTPTLTPTLTPTESPTPTLEPSVTPTETPIPTKEPSPSPTVEPTAIPSPEPSETPSPTPTVEPTSTPIPTEVPSITPTTEPSPTLTPVPTAEPTPTVIPSPTPTRGPIIVTKNPIMTCSLTFKPIRIFRYVYFFPIIDCVKTSI